MDKNYNIVQTYGRKVGMLKRESYKMKQSIESYIKQIERLKHENKLLKDKLNIIQKLSQHS